MTLSRLTEGDGVIDGSGGGVRLEGEAGTDFDVEVSSVDEAQESVDESEEEGVEMHLGDCN